MVALHEAQGGRAGGLNTYRRCRRGAIGVGLVRGVCTTFAADSAAAATCVASIAPMTRFDRLLQDELARRRRINPSYSTRALARSLGMHHATLSRLLRGHTRASPATLRSVAARLGVRPAHVAELLAANDALRVETALARRGARPSSRWIASVTGLDVDAVNVALQRLLAAGSLRMASRDRWGVGA